MSDLWDYPVEYLSCRAWGHHWETKGAFMESEGGVRAIRQRWTCSCGCTAVDTFTPTTFIRTGQRAYTWPDKYRPAPDRIDARKEWYRRHPPTRSTTRKESSRAGSR